GLLSRGAAPAPLPRPWALGWDRPVDPLGDCRFERAGEVLTITVPGERHGLEASGRYLNAPRLLRDVKGDFSSVRVGGGLRPGGRNRCRSAGLVVTDGRALVRLVRTGARLSGGEETPTLC